MKFYAVRVGRNPGIYNNWSDASREVLGFSGAIYKSFNTESAAREFIGGHTPTICSDAIYVDGTHNKTTGNHALARVTDKHGNNLIAQHIELFDDMIIDDNYIVCCFGDLKQQNNGAELLALIAGMRIAMKIGCTYVCSDSNLVVSYWSLGLVNDNTRREMDGSKYHWILICSDLRKQFEHMGGSIIKIDGAENPADFGFHH